MRDTTFRSEASWGTSSAAVRTVRPPWYADPCERVPDMIGPSTRSTPGPSDTPEIPRESRHDHRFERQVL